MLHRTTWAMGAGGVIGFLSAHTIATIASAALNGPTPYDRAAASVGLWLILLLAGPAAALGCALLCRFYYAVGAVRLSTLMGAAAGPILGLPLGLLIDPQTGTALGPLALVLWEWAMTGIGAVAGSIVGRTAVRFD